MVKAIRVRQNGGPEVMQWEDVALGKPGRGEALIRHTAIGVNYLDTYHRTGLYNLPLPIGLGSEAAGVVEAVGAGVTHIKPGDRIAYAGGAPGSYSEARVMPADRLVKIPNSISDDQAAAMMLKGMTVQYLVRKTYRVKAGETVLFHAAAGGVGLIACQWLKALGANVIGTVSSDEKAKLAKTNGCKYPIVYTRENFVERVKKITKNQGVPVVYDSVGKDTFAGSLDCLRPLGLMVSFGNASGPVPPFPLAMLAQKGSLYITRPTLVTHTAKRPDLEKTARELFRMVADKKVKIRVSAKYPLREAAQAHRDLEGRKTTGSIVLVP
jgi:NADPH:quinone reductase-like Zn-dependent oxidoreductase